MPNASTSQQTGDICRPTVRRVEVIRKGRLEPYLATGPVATGAIQCAGLAVEGYRTPACVISQHEHVQHFVHVVVSGVARYEVLTAGKCLHFCAQPGTTFVLPQGTVDELRWAGPTHGIAVGIEPRALADALEETVGENGIELNEHWNLEDRHIMSLLQAMTADLDGGSPAGRLYGESLANALCAYLLARHAVRPHIPRVCKGGLPGYRLKRVLDYIRDNLTEDLGLMQLSELAGMSPHYFAELFKMSMGCPPHRFVLRERIERAKDLLRDPKRSVLEVGMGAGFQNPSHFARMFHRLVGASPSRFRSDHFLKLKI